MCVCVCVYRVYVNIYACMYVCMCVYVYVCICINVWGVWVYVSVKGSHTCTYNRYNYSELKQFHLQPLPHSCQAAKWWPLIHRGAYDDRTEGW